MAALNLGLDNTATQQQLESADRRTQHYAAIMARMQEHMQRILQELRVKNDDLESRYHHLTTNLSFANNPRYRNLRAALRNLYPGENTSNDVLESLIRGNMYIPNITPENTENTRTKKSRARNTLAALRGGKGKSRHRSRKSTTKRAKY